MKGGAGGYRGGGGRYGSGSDGYKRKSGGLRGGGWWCRYDSTEKTVMVEKEDKQIQVVTEAMKVVVVVTEVVVMDTKKKVEEISNMGEQGVVEVYTVVVV
ncbi:predicted protein [Arabidopsis lyrata subsp. lyrata]|uniref:Predicted protein n=1 Tax=Arabidopsis lyrata subsp. lyrata TaxID=81972 RepID=D7M704_ARALL|nr:predicted protein [Arabidopsis lyrata subsp. lyrata]